MSQPIIDVMGNPGNYLHGVGRLPNAARYVLHDLAPDSIIHAGENGG